MVSVYLISMEKQLLDKVELKVDLKGVYSLPQEWKTADEANPSTFEYQLRLQSLILDKGKYCLREPSETEIRKQQEDLDNKNKGGAIKGGKGTIG